MKQRRTKPKNFSKLKQLLKSEKGFSLVGVLTASTIGFIVLMGIVESMGNISKSVRKGNQTLSVLEIRKDIMGIAMENTTHTGAVSACTNTLKGIKTNGHSADQDTNIHTYTFPEESPFKKAGLSPGADSGYKVYKNDNNNSDVYFGSLIINQMRFEKEVPSPAPTTNFVATKGNLYITFLDKNKSYIQFEDLTPLIVENITYQTDNETISSCNFKLDARTIVDCYKVEQNGLSLVGCDSTQAIPIAQTTAYGFGIAGSSLTGAYNSFFGYETAKNNTSGASNSFFGYQAGYNNNTGSDNSFFGHETAFSNTAGAKNSFFGHSAGYKNITGNESVFVGYQAGYNNSSASKNTFVGTYSGHNNTANYNNFFGYMSGYNNTTGEQNTFLGLQAGYRNTSGRDNTFLGHIAGSANISGMFNTSIGAYSNSHNETGSHNTIIGYGSGGKGKNNSKNTMIGKGAGVVTRGNNNTYLGFQAGHWIGGLKNSGTKSNNNIMIGSETSFGTYPTGGCADPCPSSGIGSNNIFIGHRIATRYLDNEIRIGNAIHESVLIATRSKNPATDKLKTLEIGKLAHIEKDLTGKPAVNGNPAKDPAHFIKIADLLRIEKDLNSNNHIIKIGDNNFTDVKIGAYDLNVMSNNILALDNKVNTLDAQINAHSHPSSKVLKKNIQPWTDYEMALKDIMETPLSTWQYKDKDSWPDHSRRSFIAEDLPLHLQLPQEENSELVKPDWPSIWGSFWASLKALAIKFDGLKEEISEKWAVFAKSLEALKQGLADLEESFSIFQSDMTKTTEELKEENRKLKRELAETKQEMADIKTDLKKLMNKKGN